MRMFYSVHAKERMVERYITDEEIIEAIEAGEIKENHEEGLFEVEYNRVRIVFGYDSEEETVTVVTAIHSREFSKEIKKHSRRNKVGVRASIRTLKGVA